jgi:hypothetical protein
MMLDSARPVFCPLKRRYFQLVLAGRKVWEIRSADGPVGRAIIKRTPPFPIVLRLGYSGRVVVATAVEVRRFRSPESIPKGVLDGACVTLHDLQELGIRGEVVATRFEVRAHGGAVA